MKFSTKEDIEAPIEAVFKAVSDFNAFERFALRRGARVQRVDRKTHPQTTIAWDIEFPYRGKKRQFLAELTEFDAPHHILLPFLSGGINGDVLIDLVALSRNRTRLSIAFEIRPKTLPARLIVQSLRLAKNKLTNRYKMRVANFAMEIEDGYKRGRLT